MEEHEATSQPFKVASAVDTEDRSPRVVLHSPEIFISMSPLQACALGELLIREAKASEIQARMMVRMRVGNAIGAKDMVAKIVHDLTCDCDTVAPPEFEMDVHNHGIDSHRSGR